MEVIKGSKKNKRGVIETYTLSFARSKRSLSCGEFLSEICSMRTRNDVNLTT